MRPNDIPRRIWQECWMTAEEWVSGDVGTLMEEAQWLVQSTINKQVQFIIDEQVRQWQR
jgi:hypothetical protein